MPSNASDVAPQTWQVLVALHLTAPARQSAGSDGNKTFTYAFNVPSPGRAAVRVPYITAPSVRQKIRSACMLTLERAIVEREPDTRVDPALHASLVRGSHDRAALSTADVSVAQRRAAMRHVAVGLFGGGSSMHSGKLSMCRPLWPIVHQTRTLLPPEHAALVNEASAGAPLTQFVRSFPRDPMTRSLPDWVDLGAETNAPSGSALADVHPEDFPAAANEPAVERRSGLSNSLEHEVIPPGTMLSLAIRLDEVTPAQLGLALMGLEAFASAGVVGGDAARGMGSFNLAGSLLQRCASGASDSPDALGQPLLEGQPPFVRLSSHPVVASAVAAARAELALAGMNELHMLMPTETAKSLAARDQTRDKPRADAPPRRAGARTRPAAA